MSEFLRLLSVSHLFRPGARTEWSAWHFEILYRRNVCICTPLPASLLFFSSVCLEVRKFSAYSFFANPHKGFRTPRIWNPDPARMQVFRCLARFPLGWGSTRWFFLPCFGNFSKVLCATATLQVFRMRSRTLARKASDQHCLPRPNGSSPDTLAGCFANLLSPKQQLLLLLRAAIQPGLFLLCLENRGHPIFCLPAIPKLFVSPF